MKENTSGQQFGAERARLTAATPQTAIKGFAGWFWLVAALCLYLAPLVMGLSPSGGIFLSGSERSDIPPPGRSITIIAPASPGGGWDQLARLMQHVLTTDKISQVPVEVINRGGAGGTIGLAELVTQHRADPNVLMVGGSTLVSALVMHDSRIKLSEANLIARLASEYNVIAVSVDSPFESFEDLLAEFKANPESFVWGGGSAGSADHLLIGQVALEAGLDPRRMNYVAYPGGGEAAAAVIGGQVTAGVAGFAEWKDLASANKMRLLAISSPERLSGVDVPTIKDFGLDVALENWRFVVAPPGVSQQDQQRLVDMMTTMRNSEEWRAILERNVWEDRFLTGVELEKFVADEALSIAKLLGTLGLGAYGEGYAATGPYLFPVAILITLGLLAAALFHQSRRRTATALCVDEAPSPGPYAKLSWRRFMLSAGLILAYILVLDSAGFYIATPVYLVLQARLISEGHARRNITAAVIFTCLTSVLFEYVLRINVP